MRPYRLFSPDMYRFDTPQPSYWEALASGEPELGTPLAGEASCDVAIIGAGYTGLSAALHLARDHGVDARVLDAGHIGWGASGRNAGFCCIGGTSIDIGTQIKKYGLEDTQRWYRAQVEAVELVRQLGDEEAIDLQIQGDCEFDVAYSPASFKDLQEDVKMQRDLMGLDSKILQAGEVKERFFDSTEQYGAAQIRPTFALNPLSFVRGLAQAAERHGAKLHGHSEVVEWRKEKGEHLLVTRNGLLRAKRVIIATNGFAAEHLSKDIYGRPLPVISAMVVTRPLTDDELAAHHWKTLDPIISSRILLNYFRLLPDKRFMFGGRGHSKGDAQGAGKTYLQIQQKLAQLWPAWKDIAIDYRWHGLICFTRDRRPAIGQLADDASVFYGFGYHGNGVNTATWTGKQLADWAGQSSPGHEGTPDQIPVVARGLTRRFPFPGLRRRYLQGALTWYRFRDWIH